MVELLSAESNLDNHNCRLSHASIVYKGRLYIFGGIDNQHQSIYDNLSDGVLIFDIGRYIAYNPV
jgi:PAS domain-containing protein